MNIQPILGALHLIYEIVPDGEGKYFALSKDNVRCISETYGATPALKKMTQPWNLPFLLAEDVNDTTVYVLNTEYRILGSWEKGSGYNIINFLNDNKEAYLNDWGYAPCNLSSRVRNYVMLDDYDIVPWMEFDDIVIYTKEGEFKPFKQLGKHRIGYCHSITAEGRRVTVYDWEKPINQYTIPDDYPQPLYNAIIGKDYDLFTTTGSNCGTCLYFYKHNRASLEPSQWYCFDRLTGKETPMSTVDMSIVPTEGTALLASVPPSTHSNMPIESYYNGHYYGGVYIEGSIFSGNYSYLTETLYTADLDFQSYTFINSEAFATANSISFEEIVNSQHPPH